MTNEAQEHPPEPEKVETPSLTSVSTAKSDGGSTVTVSKKRPRKKERKEPEASAIMEILTAIRRLGDKGLSHEQIVVLVADQLYGARYWKEKKSQVRGILSKILEVSEGIK